MLTPEEKYDRVLSLLSKLFVWGSLFALVYILRSFSLLMFLVFVFSYIQSNAVNRLEPWIKKRKVRAVLVGGLFMAILVLVGAFLIPQFREQAMGFTHNFSTYARNLDEEAIKLSTQYPVIAEFLPIENTKTELEQGTWDLRHSTLAQLITPLFTTNEGVDSKAVKSTLTTVGNIGSAFLGISSQFLLSLLFSFLIVYDLPNLQRGARSLRDSRLRYVYDEVADSLISFGRTLGRAFEAQIQIAIANTLLTAIGVWFINIRDELAFISLVVFLCSFIPIVGVLMSSLPICLLALASGGPAKVVVAIILIAAIHALEAYVLNPRIFGHHLRLNSVIVVILVTISGKLFGLWGLILCLPITTFIAKDAIRFKDIDDLEPKAPEEDLQPNASASS